MGDQQRWLGRAFAPSAASAASMAPQELTQLGLLLRTTHLVVRGTRDGCGSWPALGGRSLSPEGSSASTPLHQDFPADLRPRVHVRMHLAPRLLFELQGQSL